jgi:5-deoxy-glucuronate isomerase
LPDAAIPNIIKSTRREYVSSLYQVPAHTGCCSVFKWGEGTLNYLSLDSIRLDPGGSCHLILAEEEAAFVTLGGTASVQVKSSSGKVSEWRGVGGRPDPFSGSPGGVYIPRAAEIGIQAESRLEAAIARAPCDADLEPALITPDQVRVVSAGAANWRRDVRLVIPPGSPTSQRLIVGETLNPPGNWSGIPPHKHDRIAAEENILDEFYYFKVRPPESYGVQMIYGHGEKGEALIVSDDDVAVFPGGYHPTVAAPGTTVFYLWALAGGDKAYKIGIDPRFGWVSQAEAVLREGQRS